MNIQLYNYFRSSPSFRVRIALHYKELEFQYHPINLLKGEQHEDAYKKVNASGEVPALIHEGQLITQSVAIIDYLDDIFPNPPLYPRQPSSRARVRSLCESINCTHPLQNLQVLRYLEDKAAFDADKKKQWTSHWMAKNFAYFENFVRHTSGKYSFGDQVTAADLFLIPQLVASARFAVDLTPHPQLNRIFDNCMKLTAFQKAHPDNQIDRPENLASL